MVKNKATNIKKKLLPTETSSVAVELAVGDWVKLLS